MPLISSRASASVRAFGLTVLSALTSVIDTFNRANQSGLGIIKGQKWKVWRGVWSIVSNKASSSSTAGDNALATLKFTKTDVTVSISGAEPGMGATFWVTDADNWYASVYTQTQVCQTCANCNSWNASNCNAFNPVVCNAWTSGNCNSWTSGNCNSWNASNCNAFNPVVCNAWNSVNCATWAIGNCASGEFCCVWTTGNCNAWTLGPCNIWNSANSGNKAPPYGFCWGPSRNPSTCNSFNNICTGNCCNGNFPTWSPYCTSNNTSNCNTFSGGNCNSFNPSNCNAFNPNVCNSFNPSNCNAFSGGNCNSFNPITCNSFFSFPCNCTIEHRVNIIKSIGNVISTISNNLFSVAVQSFKVLLSGSDATISAYSTTSYNSQIGNSVSSQIENPVKTSQHGIIKSSSSYSQGSTIDEFGVN